MCARIKGDKNQARLGLEGQAAAQPNMQSDCCTTHTSAWGPMKAAAKRVSSSRLRAKEYLSWHNEDYPALL